MNQADTESYLLSRIEARDSAALEQLRIAIVEAEGAVIALRQADAMIAPKHYYIEEAHQFGRMAETHRAEMRSRLALAFASLLPDHHNAEDPLPETLW